MLNDFIYREYAMADELIYWRILDVFRGVLRECKARVYYSTNNIEYSPVYQLISHCVLYLSKHVSCLTKENNYLRFIILKCSFLWRNGKLYCG